MYCSQCHVVAVAMGDYNDDLGDLGGSYTVSNGTISATFTPEQFFQGQDAGDDFYAQAG